jgi:phosphoglycerate dehydrogenase-like enzyme
MDVVMQFDAGSTLERRLADFSVDGVSVTACPVADKSRFAALMSGAAVLWHVLEPVTADVIAAAPSLRLIQKIGVGVNTIDLAAAKGRGIAVCNLPGTNSRAVAELTLLLMLAVLRRLRELDGAVRRGAGWPLDTALQDGLGEIGGRTVGLIGYGAVARVLAPILIAMGATVLYTARSPKDDAVGAWRDLDDLVREADILSLHAPLNEETKGMIGAAALARMKPGASLINTARGGLVDEAALTAALVDGHLAGAGLDVFGDEPPVPDNALLALEQVVLTPHVAWLTAETLDRSLAVAVENCRRLAAGDDLLHRVA